MIVNFYFPEILAYNISHSGIKMLLVDEKGSECFGELKLKKEDVPELINTIKTEEDSFSWTAGSGTDPPTLAGLTARGYSIQVPEDAVYAFIAITTDTNTTGSITFKPYQIHSELKMARVNNTPPDLVGAESRSPYNQIFWTTETVFTDTAGVAAEVKEIEQNIATITADYVSKSNTDTQTTNSSFVFKGSQNSYTFPNNQGLKVTDVASYVHPGTQYNIIQSFKGAGINGYNTGTKSDPLYLRTINADGNQHIVKVTDSGGLDTQDMILVPDEKGIELKTSTGGAGSLTGKISLAEDKSGMIIAAGDGGANQADKITFMSGVGNPENAISMEVGDLTGTSSLNMNSNLIHNLGTPVSGTDAANKSYVDSHVDSNYLSTTSTDPQSVMSSLQVGRGDTYFRVNNNQGIISTSVNSYVPNGAIYNIISSSKGAGIKGRHTSSASPIDELYLQTINTDGSSRQVRIDRNGSVIAQGRFSTPSSSGYYLINDAGATYGKIFQSNGNTFFTSGNSGDKKTIFFKANDSSTGTQSITFNMGASKNIDLNNAYKIQNMTDPTADQDAATKKYVDQAVVSGGVSNTLDLINHESWNSFGINTDTFQFGLTDFAFEEGMAYQIVVSLTMDWTGTYSINQYDLKGLQMYHGFNIPDSGNNFSGVMKSSTCPDYIRSSLGNHLTKYSVELQFRYVAFETANHRFCYAWTIANSTNWQDAWGKWRPQPYGNLMSVSAYKLGRFSNPTPSP